MIAICINDRKCRNLLRIGEEYEVEQSKNHKNCYTVKIKDNAKKGNTAKKHIAFKKDRFVVVKR